VITTTFFSANTPVAAAIFIYLVSFLALCLLIFWSHTKTESILLQIILPQIKNPPKVDPQNTCQSVANIGMQNEFFLTVLSVSHLTLK
jgi:hypothetical protein